MEFEEFVGKGEIEGYEPDPEDTDALTDPLGYEASEPLVHAVNVALRLSMPLLITGAPGTGKSQLAYRLAAEMNVGKPIRFNTKSSSQANDLFYTFDSVRYFAQSQVHAARDANPPSPLGFLRYVSLGEAIVRSWPRKKVEEILPPGFTDYEPQRMVVLIDEIDKAPRDFPNDLLNQIENLEFTITELMNRHLVVNPAYRPVVVITSNSERQLPEPFLRRCVYHHIESSPEHITAVVERRLKKVPLATRAFREARDFFFRLRGAPGTDKAPSTSELLDWLQALHGARLRGRELDPDESLASQAEVAETCLGTLAKTPADLAHARELLTRPAQANPARP